MTQQQEYRLGRKVTEQARAREDRGTVVVSFRVSAKEFDELSDLADSEGKTVSQVAREAFRHGLTFAGPSRWAAISFINGSMVSFGDAYQCTFGTGEPDVEEINQMSEGFVIKMMS